MFEPKFGILCVGGSIQKQGETCALYQKNKETLGVYVMMKNLKMLFLRKSIND